MQFAKSLKVPLFASLTFFVGMAAPALLLELVKLLF